MTNFEQGPQTEQPRVEGLRLYNKIPEDRVKLIAAELNNRGRAIEDLEDWLQDWFDDEDTSPENVTRVLELLKILSNTGYSEEVAAEHMPEKVREFVGLIYTI